MKNKVVTDPGYDAVNNCFERALVFMHKMPRIWIDYIKFLTKQGKVVTTRRVCDRALRALPPTQNDRVWPLYIKFVTSHPIPETAVRVFRRYLQMFPEHSEQFIDYLIKVDRLDEASQVLAKIVNDADFASRAGKSNHQLWNELCDLISKNPGQIKSLNVDAIIRGGLRKYTDHTGQHCHHQFQLQIELELIKSKLYFNSSCFGNMSDSQRDSCAPFRHKLNIWRNG